MGEAGEVGMRHTGGQGEGGPAGSFMGLLESMLSPLSLR